MSRNGGDEGCGCLLLVVGALVLLSGGSIFQALGTMLASWFGFFVFIAMTAGIMVLIINVISGRR